jgi:large conductance mechanosensitive channel
MWKEFKAFITRGNMIDMAIAFTVGAAFTALVKSLVDNIIMPPIAFLLGKVSFTDRFAILRQGKVAGPYATLQAANEAGAVTLSYGLFINALVSFLVIAIVVFLLVKGMNKLMVKKPAAPAAATTKKCPYCFTEIALEATRCPNCTSQL